MLELSMAELSVLDWIAVHLHTPWLDTFMVWITTLGDGGLVWICLGVAFLFQGRKEQSYGLQILLALILSLLLCNMLLKNAVGRIRPFNLAQITDLLVSRPLDGSFPSGHTSASFAAAGVLLLHRYAGRWAGLVFACLIAFSRLYLYMHFPTDVLVGVLTGLFCAFLSVTIWKYTAQRWIPYFRQLDQSPIETENAP